MMDELPLIGRTEELGYLLTAVRERGGAVLGGAAGIGKTRLARAVVSELPGWHVSWASLTAASGALPLGGVAALGLMDGDPVREGRTGLLSRLTELLTAKAAGRPSLLVVDDAHLLDELSAGFVHHAASSAAAAVLLTVRTGEQPPSPVVALYKDGLIPRLELHPLGATDAGTLAAAALGGEVHPATLHALWSQTAGNVLFLRELLADAREAGRLRRIAERWVWQPGGGLGPRLTELVADRIGRLQGPRRRLAEVLAVGEPLGLEVLGRLVPDADLVEAERAGLISVEEVPPRADIRLAHPLFAEVIRAGMPALLRRKLRGELAGALRDVGTRGRNDVLRMAVWQLDSGAEMDAPLLAEAATQARNAFDPQLAERLARASLTAGPSFEAALVLGGALGDLGRFREALAVLDPLPGTEPDAGARQTLARERAWAAFHTSGLPRARAILEQAEAEPGDDRTGQQAARGELTLLLTYAGRFPEAAVIGAPLLAKDVPDTVRIRALPGAGAALVMAGHAEEVLALCLDLAGVADRLASAAPRASGLVWQMQTNALIMSGRVDEAAALLAERLAPESVPLLGEGDLAYARVKLGMALLRQGRPATAAAHLADAAVVLRHTDPNACLPWALSLAAEAHAALGQLDVATAEAAEAAACRSTGLAAFDGDARRARAQVSIATGDTTRGITGLVEAATLQQDRGQPAFALFALLDAMTTGAREVCEQAEALAAAAEGPGPAAIAAYARGLRRGDPGALEAAARSLAGLGLRVAAAGCAAAAAAGWAAQGLPARAATAAAARSGYLAGTELRSETGTEPLSLAQLTRREREVATFAARGLSNVRIAERLNLSVRTVESHLYAAYGKLGVRGRGELTTVLGLR
ncbi:hypothetical protein HFP15_08175 [Amycolatopsis sp. K13G38]|uniref:HTH luxR-type domain-containing protein n=1 Tax=Amycolatopsis acididurans TaxID=2724524 RepID=A0ABX1J0D9_9PSEU|nr:helix-turn-helix transcriptional regulator [Amycolatopsis acididurans]NKQ52856.1 hypothetical protein [Amycolatopsis acididurans]